MTLMKSHFSILVLALSASAFSWHDAGHRAVALIAWEELSGPEKARITEILKDLPAVNAPLNSFPYPTLGNPVTGTATGIGGPIDWAAVWPDKVREPNGNWLHQGKWHYKDGVILGPGGSLPSGTNGVADLKIEQLASVIRGQAPSTTKAVALAWLCHLVGDVHQPLHAAAYYDRRHRDGDQGGNNYFLRRSGSSFLPNEGRNLHSYWDGLGNRDQDSVETIMVEAAKYRSSVPTISMDQVGSEVKKWLGESLKLAKTDVYPKVHGGRKRLDPFASNPYSASYRTNCQRVCFRRIQEAGQRLAGVLKAALN